jgi:hypothetical protein
MEAYPEVLGGHNLKSREAQHGFMEAHQEPRRFTLGPRRVTMKSWMVLRAFMEAHPEPWEVHCGSMEAHPEVLGGSLQGHVDSPWRLS